MSAPVQPAAPVVQSPRSPWVARVSSLALVAGLWFYPVPEGLMSCSDCHNAHGSTGPKLAKRDTIREYEEACESAGLHAGLVDLSTFSVVNCYLAGGRVPTGDWLLIQMRPDYTSIAIMRGGDVIFFRNKGEGEGDTLADLVHQSTMYYQDRLSGQGFTRVLVGGTGRPGGDLEMARRGLEDRLGVPVETIDPTRVAAFTDRITVTRDVMARLAPLVGMMLRTRQEPVTV